MKKDIRLYNVIFPIWILMFWPTPPIILITLLGNLVIDCLVLYLALRAVKHPGKKEVVKGLWYKFWGFGFLADIVGAGWLFGNLYAIELVPFLGFMDSFVNVINPWKNPLSLLWTLSGVAIAGVCIYFFDKRAMKNCALLDKRQKHIIALAMAVVTAPWLFLVPLYW